MDNPKTKGADDEMRNVHVAESGQQRGARPTCELARPRTRGRGTKSRNGLNAP